MPYRLLAIDPLHTLCDTIRTTSIKSASIPFWCKEPVWMDCWPGAQRFLLSCLPVGSWRASCQTAPGDLSKQQQSNTTLTLSKRQNTRETNSENAEVRTRGDCEDDALTHHQAHCSMLQGLLANCKDAPVGEHMRSCWGLAFTCTSCASICKYRRPISSFYVSLCILVHPFKRVLFHSMLRHSSILEFLFTPHELT